MTKLTPSEIKYQYEHGGQGGHPLPSQRHFFERATMKFFGDTMRSFGVRQIDGVTYLTCTASLAHP